MKKNIDYITVLVTSIIYYWIFVLMPTLYELTIWRLNILNIKICSLLLPLLFLVVGVFMKKTSIVYRVIVVVFIVMLFNLLFAVILPSTFVYLKIVNLNYIIRILYNYGVVTLVSIPMATYISKMVIRKLSTKQVSSIND